MNAFEELVKKINEILGTSGIDGVDVDVEELINTLQGYRSDEDDWKRYAFADSSRAYTRNLVDHGNGKANLLILVWGPGRSSPIHDHAEAHCCMKILKGELREELFHWPCEAAAGSCAEEAGPKHVCLLDGPAEPAALEIRRQLIFKENEVTYMSDQLGLHRISNPGQSIAVSLHLYTPPNAAIYGCHIYEEATGQKHHVQQCGWFSEKGVKV